MNLRLFRKLNYKLLAPCLVLTGLGLVSLYSIGLKDNTFTAFKKQALFLGLGLVLAILLTFFDLRILKVNSFLVLGLFLLGLASLAGLFLLGGKVRGVTGWYRIGGFSFDPAPFVAILLCLILSKYFAVQHIAIQHFKPIFVSAFYTLLPCFLLIAQPDIGATSGFIAIWLGILLFSGIKARNFLIISLAFVVVAAVFWMVFMKDYQKERIYTFLNQDLNPQGNAWNITQSRIAIGNGGLWGKGFGKGSQVQLGFLPEPKTDFIFSAIAEEFGLWGVGIVLAGLIFLFYQLTRLVLQAKDNFSRLFTSGFFFFVVSQALINISMSLGLLPVVGLPLPFISYGGSYLLAFYIGIGIVMNLHHLK